MKKKTITKTNTKRQKRPLVYVFSLKHHLKRIQKQQSSLHQAAWVLVALFVLTGFPNIFTQTKHGFGVLAYATEMSQQGLLDATNQQRQNNSVGHLALNSKLTEAAQAKANDMTTRNYWSHNTPEGNPPWVFISQAGYQYKKAGENLAYGFATSDDTIIGWMNSPPHKQNLLDSSFSEVGFGYANNANYQNNGEETIVVAMYGQPYVVPSPSPTPAVKSANSTKVSPAPPPTPAPSPSPLPTKENTDVVQPIKQPTSAAYTSVQPSTVDPAQHSVSKIQTITAGKALWSGAALTIAMLLATALWVSKHLRVVRKMIKEGERFAVHHPALDVALLTFIVFAYLATRSAGFIR